ncbi:MAG: hypothetical protein ABI889_00535 [Gemmatimonadota bacterium]
MSTSLSARALFAFVISTGLVGTRTGPPASMSGTIAGVSQMKYTQQHALALAGSSSPVLLLNEASGTNRSTGALEYMSGAQVTTREIANLVRGNGPHSGYLSLGKDADSTVSKWEGKVITTLGADHQPSTRFEGTWTLMSGTGKYVGVTGTGTYKGQMISPAEYSLEWNGTLQVEPRAASR